MIDPRFIVNLRGKEYPLYAGILDAATKAGLKSLETTIVQIPSEANGWMAVVTALATFEDGRCFCDVGDCSPKNTSPQIATAALRMASTRAKGRALRDAINCGSTMLEELPDEGASTNSPSNPPQGPPQRAQRSAEPESRGDARAQEAPPCCSVAGCDNALTRGQAEVSVKAYGVPLCPRHQKEHVRSEADSVGNRVPCGKKGCDQLVGPKTAQQGIEEFGRPLCPEHLQWAAAKGLHLSQTASNSNSD